MEIKIIKDAFLGKLSSFHNFLNYYLKKNCLLETVILENEKKGDRYALVRVFIDFDHDEMPYSIFINNKEKIVFIDFVAGNQEVVENHLNFSPEQSVFVSGKIKKQEKIILKESDFLAAALLSAVEVETNLDPKNGFEELEKIMSPVVL